MTGQDYDKLLLDNQLCFPLYACSKEVVGSYRPYLDKLDLTYTQYISLLVGARLLLCQRAGLEALS